MKGTDTPSCENEDSTLTFSAGFKPAGYTILILKPPPPSPHPKKKIFSS
jgi:hypothetical protein